MLSEITAGKRERERLIVAVYYASAIVGNKNRIKKLHFAITIHERKPTRIERRTILQNIFRFDLLHACSARFHNYTGFVAICTGFLSFPLAVPFIWVLWDVQVDIKRPQIRQQIGRP